MHDFTRCLKQLFQVLLLVLLASITASATFGHSE
jgi:hypothetical protein